MTDTGHCQDPDHVGKRLIKRRVDLWTYKTTYMRLDSAERRFERGHLRVCTTCMRRREGVDGSNTIQEVLL